MGDADTSKSPTSNEAQQVGVLMFGKVAATLADAISPFLLVRLLTKHDVGLFQGVMLVHATVVMLTSAGIQPSILYYLANRDIAQRFALVRRLMGLALVIGTIAAAVLLAAGGLGPMVMQWTHQQFGWPQDTGSEMLPFLLWFCVFAIVDLPARLVPNILIAEQRPRWVAAFGIGRSISMLIAIQVPAFFFRDVTPILMSVVVFGLVQICAITLLLRKVYRGTETVPAPFSAWEMLKFGFPLSQSTIAGQLNSMIDRYIILIALGTLAYAEYQMGSWQIPLVTSTAYTVGNVYLPRMKAHFDSGNGDAAMALWRGAIQKVSLFSVPICMAFAIGAQEFITFTCTADYIKAAAVFQVYCVLTMGRVTSFGSVLLAAGRPGVIMRASFIYLASNLVISISMYGAIGFVGPAFATIIAYTIAVLTYCHYIAQTAKVPFTQTFPLASYLRVVLTAAPGAVLAATFLRLVEMAPALEFAVSAIIVLAAFALLGSWTKLIGTDDWKFALGWLRPRR